MAEDHTALTRRAALRTGLGMIAAGAMRSPASASTKRMPTRLFGRSGARVPILGLGGYFDPADGEQLLPLADELGVRVWEATLTRGALAHGDYFARFPSRRRSIFFVAKARSAEPERMQDALDRVLEDARTDYVDLFVVQGLDDPTRLTEDVRAWSNHQKRARRIKHFGFSTHANVVECLRRASELPWIDGLMAVYNYRFHEDPAARGAFEACAAAGVGLIAIKSQARPMNPAAEVGIETEATRRVIASFSEGAVGDLAHGQAKLRAVWANSSISSVLSMMGTTRLLQSNAAAAMSSVSSRGIPTPGHPASESP